MPPLKISEPVPAAPLHVYAAARSVHAHDALSAPLHCRRVFSAECIPAFDWQSVGLFYSFYHSKQPGRITRLLACEDEQLRVRARSEEGLRPHLLLHTCSCGSPGSGVPEGEPRDGTDLRAQEHAVRQDERSREVRPVPRRQGPRVPHAAQRCARRTTLHTHCICCTALAALHMLHAHRTRAPHARTAREHRTRAPHAHRRYASYNKPYSVMAWLEQRHVEEEMVLVMATRT